jgi:hypothetical protein
MAGFAGCGRAGPDHPRARPRRPSASGPNDDELVLGHVAVFGLER